MPTIQEMINELMHYTEAGYLLTLPEEKIVEIYKRLKGE